MEMFFISDYIRLHIKQVHKMTSDEYIDKYEQLESKSASLSCFICNQDVKRNLFAINKHMEMNHDMDVLAYGHKYRLKKYAVTFMRRFGSTEAVDTPASALLTQSSAKKRSVPRENTGLIKVRPGPKSKKAKITQMTLPKTKVVTKRLKWYQGSEYQLSLIHI